MLAFDWYEESQNEENALDWNIVGAIGAEAWSALLRSGTLPPPDVLEVGTLLLTDSRSSSVAVLLAERDALDAHFLRADVLAAPSEDGCTVWEILLRRGMFERPDYAGVLSLELLADLPALAVALAREFLLPKELLDGEVLSIVRKNAESVRGRPSCATSVAAALAEAAVWRGLSADEFREIVGERFFERDILTLQDGEGIPVAHICPLLLPWREPENRWMLAISDFDGLRLAHLLAFLGEISTPEERAAVAKMRAPLLTSLFPRACRMTRRYEEIPTTPLEFAAAHGRLNPALLDDETVLEQAAHMLALRGELPERHLSEELCCRIMESSGRPLVQDMLHAFVDSTQSGERTDGSVRDRESLLGFLKRLRERSPESPVWRARSEIGGNTTLHHLAGKGIVFDDIGENELLLANKSGVTVAQVLASRNVLEERHCTPKVMAARDADGNLVPHSLRSAELAEKFVSPEKAAERNNNGFSVAHALARHGVLPRACATGEILRLRRKPRGTADEHKTETVAHELAKGQDEAARWEEMRDPAILALRSTKKNSLAVGKTVAHLLARAGTLDLESTPPHILFEADEYGTTVLQEAAASGLLDEESLKRVGHMRSAAIYVRLLVEEVALAARRLVFRRD